MALTETLKKITDKEYRKLIKYLRTSDNIDLTNAKYDSWNKIKKYINKNVKSIKINMTPEIKKDLPSFESYHNLEQLDFGSNSGLNEEELNFFSRLGIKELYVGDVLINNTNARKDMITVASGEKTLILYNGMIVNISSHNREIENKKIIIEAEYLDYEETLKLINKMELSGIEDIEINRSFAKINSYTIKKHENIIDTLDIVGYNLGEVEKFYNSLLYKGYQINEVKIIERNCTLNDALKLMYLCNDTSLNKANIICYGKNFYINTKLENGKTESKIEVEDLKNIKEIYNELIKNDIKIDSLTIDISAFKNKYSENFDIDFLRTLSKKINLNIQYSSYICDFEEWTGLYESIKWYRKLITSYNLSPVERVMYAYDLMKSIPYKDSEQIGDPGRAPHLVMSTEYIVCAGYAETFCEIINGLDSNIGATTTSFKTLNHASILVRVDDEKYNIHGIFELDPMFDNEILTTIKEQYNFNIETGLDLYETFLVTLKDHNKIYGIKELPNVVDIFLRMTQKENKIDEQEIYLMFYKIKLLFGEYASSEKVLSYLRAEKPSLTDFKNMLLTVREAEGFTPEEAIKEVERVVKLNIDYLNYISKIYNFPEIIEKKFFEDKITHNK